MTRNLPHIPPFPHQVWGVERPVTDLNDNWLFLPRPVLEVPAIDAKNRDFDFSAIDENEWKNVRVPGELATQGFDIDNNEEYYYKRNILIPADFEGKRAFVRFDGVYSNARVWADGRFVTEHMGGFTSWYCDITPYAEPGKSVNLTVGVADLDGDGAGKYNPEGKNFLRNSASASLYAHHNVGGILREVSLVALGESYISDLKADFTSGCFVDVEVQAYIAGGNGEIALEITSPDGKTAASGAICLEADNLGFYSGKARLKIDDPVLWDSEHPRLYALNAVLSVGGREIQSCSSKIGLREIVYGGKNGTDRNKIYVNGQAIKLRGVCRHDISPDNGRCSSREQLYKEVRAYKDCNINFIRTSHYPPSRHLLDACDEIGMYVEEENAVCFQGDNNYDIHCAGEDMLSQFKEMVVRDRNHACVIIWSLGNESSFEKTTGFQMEYEFIKEFDVSRPVIFSYPFTVERASQPYDIISCHYAYVDGGLGNPTLPILHDEFAHIPCYNVSELRNDTNVHAWWGRSLALGWNNLYRADGALGCALWCVSDETFYLPQGVKTKHSFDNWVTDYPAGRGVGFGPWGCVFDSFMRVKPEAYMVKKAYSPIRINEKEFFIDGECLCVPVENWFNHTNLNEMKLAVTLDGANSGEIEMPDVKPGQRGIIRLKGDWRNIGEVRLSFSDKFATPIDSFLLRIHPLERIFETAGGSAPTFEKANGRVTVKGGDFEITFDEKALGIVEAKRKGETLITGGPCFRVLDNFDCAPKPGETVIDAANTGDHTLVKMHARYQNGIRVQFNIRVYRDARMEITYLIDDMDEAAWKNVELSGIGLSFDLPKGVNSVSWLREGQYNSYPEGHIGRIEGKAILDSGVREEYAEDPKCDWKDDMRDYFLFAPQDPEFGLSSNDFKATRENIRFYSVFFDGLKSHLRLEAQYDAAARVEVKAGENGVTAKLLVKNFWAYPSLEWGNYLGRVPNLSKRVTGACTLRLSDRRD